MTRLAKELNGSLSRVWEPSELPHTSFGDVATRRRIAVCVWGVR